MGSDGALTSAILVGGRPRGSTFDTPLAPARLPLSVAPWYSLADAVLVASHAPRSRSRPQAVSGPGLPVALPVSTMRARSWQLILQFALKDFKIRYTHSVLGYAWSVLNPLVFALIYYFVFSVFVRFDIPNYPGFLLIGIVLWNFFSEGSSNGVGSLLARRRILTKVGDAALRRGVRRHPERAHHLRHQPGHPGGHPLVVTGTRLTIAGGRLPRAAARPGAPHARASRCSSPRSTCATTTSATCGASPCRSASG